MAEIEKIVFSLESGELGLAESLEEFERAVNRLKQCHGLLEAAEQQVSVLSGFDADGNPVLESMDELENEGLKEKQAARSRRRGAKKKSPSVEIDGNEDSDANSGMPGLF